MPKNPQKPKSSKLKSSINKIKGKPYIKQSKKSQKHMDETTITALDYCHDDLMHAIIPSKETPVATDSIQDKQTAYENSINDVDEMNKALDALVKL